MDDVSVRTAVGVTDMINQEQLLAFATDRQYVMKIQDFSELPSTLQMSINAMQALCGRVTVSGFTVFPSKRLFSASFGWRYIGRATDLRFTGRACSVSWLGTVA